MDWLDTFKQYKYIKELSDFIDDVEKLRFYYQTMQYDAMQRHIDDLTRKYPFETAVWNSINTNKPQTYEQSFISAEVFLQAVGVKKLAEKNIIYK